MGLYLWYFTALVLLATSVAADDCDACGANTNCNNGECVCKTDYVGDPYFHCYYCLNKHCRISSDPVLETFRKQHVRLITVGSSRFAQFWTSSRNGPSEECDIDITIFTGRYRGKIFIAGAQAKMVRTYGVNQVAEASVRIFGEYSSGVYSWAVDSQGVGETDFTSLGTITSTQPNGQARRQINVNGCKIRISRNNDFLVVEFECCGTTFGLRPYNPDNRLKKPGIFLEIDIHQHEISFSNFTRSQEPLCLSPDHTLSSVANANGLTEIPDAISFLSFTNGGVKFVPGVGLILNVGAKLVTCSESERNEVYNWARFMLEHAAFVRCIGSQFPTLHQLVLFYEAVRSVCEGNTVSCNSLKNVLIDRCPALAADPPEVVQSFLDRPC